MPPTLLPPGTRRLILDLKEVGLPEVPCFGVHDLHQAVDGLHQHIHVGAIEICYLVRGVRAYAVRERDYTLRGNDVFVSYPDEPHGSGGNPHGKGRLYWMQVRLPRREEGFLALQGREARPLVEALRNLPRRLFPGTRNLQTLFEQVLDDVRGEETPLRKLRIATGLVQWLQTVIACAYAGGDASLSSDILTVQQRIEGDLERDWSVADLARVAGLSVSRFKAKWKNETGVPAREYVLRRKMEEAKRLLRDTSLPVTEIAYRLGFSSSQYFATVFKRYTHRTPTSERSNA